MKLYTLSRGSHFRLLEKPQVPPDALPGFPDTDYKILNLDGMYCNCVDETGERVYFAAWTEVEEV